MQRRKGDSKANASNDASDSAQWNATRSSYKDKPSSSAGHSFRNNRNAKAAVFCAACVFAAVWVFSSRSKYAPTGVVKNVEDKVWEFENKALDRVEDWVVNDNANPNNNNDAQPQQEPNNNNQAGGGGGGGANNNNDDPQPLKPPKPSTSYSWVEGEKKLKQALEALAERQKKGLDLGVPILTRWLGDDIPAWCPPDQNEAEWQEQVKKRTAEMDEADLEWKKAAKEYSKKNPVKYDRTMTGL